MNWIDSLEARWQAWWPELEAREQRLLIAGATLVGLALLWWIALAPALATLSNSSAENARLDAQLQQMTELQKQARALQSQPRASRDDALRALETSVRERLGANTQLQSTGASEGVTVSMRAATADALAQWLGQARSNARAVPREAHLTRNNVAGGAPNAPVAAGADGEAPRVRWDGTLVMGLPAR